MIEAFARQVDVGPSALGDAQNELLATGVLVAAHPSRSGPLLRQQTAEAARGIASQILAGLMELNGADAASIVPLGHPIAMAYTEAAHASDGTELEIEVRGKRLPARVVPLPFVPHRYHRKGAA